jgi:hypothetical protein
LGALMCPLSSLCLLVAGGVDHCYLTAWLPSGWMCSRETCGFVAKIKVGRFDFKSGMLE